MPKPTDEPTPDPNLAAFRAILEKKKAAKAAPIPGKATGLAQKPQKPRPKEKIRRRP